MSDEMNNSAACTSDCSTCGGNCGGGDMEMGASTVTLTLDDDTEVTCAVLNIFGVNKNEYISLLPLNEEGQNTTGEVYIYRFLKNENGDPCLENIEDDEEYAQVGEVFNDLMNKAVMKENELEGIVEKE